MEYLAKMYADLVEASERALTQEDATRLGVPMVPAFIRTKVIAEIERRQAAA